MPSGSRPLTGSSNISTGGSPSSAAAMPSRCFMPSEKPPTRRRATASSPVSPSTSVTRCWPIPLAWRHRPQVRPAGPARVQGGRVEQRADLAQRPDQPVVAAAADQGPAGGRRVQAEDHPHRGGLARAVRAEEAGDPPGTDREAQVVDRGDRAEALAEPLHLDHCGPPFSQARRRRSSREKPLRVDQLIATATALIGRGRQRWAGPYPDTPGHDTLPT